MDRRPRGGALVVLNRCIVEPVEDPTLNRSLVIELTLVVPHLPVKTGPTDWYRRPFTRVEHLQAEVELDGTCSPVDVVSSRAARSQRWVAAGIVEVRQVKYRIFGRSRVVAS